MTYKPTQNTISDTTILSLHSLKWIENAGEDDFHKPMQQRWQRPSGFLLSRDNMVRTIFTNQWSNDHNVHTISTQYNLRLQRMPRFGRRRCQDRSQTRDRFGQWTRAHLLTFQKLISIFKIQSSGRQCFEKRIPQTRPLAFLLPVGRIHRQRLQIDRQVIYSLAISCNINAHGKNTN